MNETELIAGPAVDGRCPTCGGDPAHAPKSTPAAYDARVTIHHPGPDYRYPVTVYLKVTVPAGEAQAVAEAAMAAVGAVHDTRLAGVKVGWSKDRYDTFSNEAPRPQPLPCGCSDLDEHREGVEMQADMRRQYRISKDACVGCQIGDDGPSMHSCVAHERRYWPKAVSA